MKQVYAITTFGIPENCFERIELGIEYFEKSPINCLFDTDNYSANPK